MRVYFPESYQIYGRHWDTLAVVVQLLCDVLDGVWGVWLVAWSVSSYMSWYTFVCNRAREIIALLCFLVFFWLGWAGGERCWYVGDAALLVVPSGSRRLLGSATLLEPFLIWLAGSGLF